MKNVIKYFYNIELENIRMIDDNYYFIYNGKKFVLYRVNNMYLNHDLINKLNSLLVKNNNNFFQIILNKDNSIITMHENNKYILMLENFSNDREFDYLDILETNIKVENTNSSGLNTWDKLWQTKVDYFEMFVANNMNKYPQLNDYYNYFIGMAENAIIYYKEAMILKRTTTYDESVISHNRIEIAYTFKDLYNPFRLMIDHPSRDLAEYLKMLFWSKKNNYNIVHKCLKNAKLSDFGASILFARMIYPSFFFDEFENLINKQTEIKKIFLIINRMSEYEQYLVQIYTILNQDYTLSKIKWIKKVDYSSTLTTPKTSGISLISMDSIPSLSVTSIMLQ